VQAQSGSGGTVPTHFQSRRYKGMGGRHHARPLYSDKDHRRRLGGPRGRFERARKISPQQGYERRSDRPVVSRYNDYAVQAANYS